MKLVVSLICIYWRCRHTCFSIAYNGELCKELVSKRKLNDRQMKVRTEHTVPLKADCTGRDGLLFSDLCGCEDNRPLETAV